MTYPWAAGEVLLAADLNSALAAKTDTAMVQNAQTGTTYSFALADASKLLTTSNASPVSVTVTKQATVTWVTGTQLRIMNLGAGVTTLVADTGVTINGNVSVKQYQGGTLIRTASDVWLFVPTASSSGMDLITPTSVAGSGVTLSGGEVTFTAATTASVNGVFTTAYDNYMIVASWNVAATSSKTSFLRWRTAGTDNTAAVYHTNINGTYVYSDTSHGLGQNYQSGDPGGYGFALTVTDPQRATVTNGFGGIKGASSSANLPAPGATAHSSASQFDGFTIAITASTFTGKIRVYGLRNS